MKKISLNMKLIFILASMSVVTVIVLYFGVTSTKEINSRLSRMVDVSISKVRFAAEINLDLLEISGAERNIILSHTPEKIGSYAGEIEESQKRIENNLQQLHELLTEDEDRETLTQFETKWKEYLEIDKEVRALANENADDKAFELIADKGRILIHNAQELISAIAVRNRESIHKDRQETNEIYVSVRNKMIFVSLLNIGLAVLFGIYLIRSISGTFRSLFGGLKSFSEAELREASEKFGNIIIGLSGSQVGASSQSLSEGASEQAASVEEAGSSLEEISSMTKQNADNANQADRLMKETIQVVESANLSMRDLTDSMGEISKASREISKIIKTIDEIAFQTNLLALNAAVEAARAGAAGAGFAVVAEEVRNLAMRSADAAKNTSAMIEDTIRKVGNGSELVTKANEAFKQVTESAVRVGSLLGEIAATSREQSQGIEQVNMAMGEMDKVAQQNAATSEELSAQAEEMDGVVNELLAITGIGRISKKHSFRQEPKPDQDTVKPDLKAAVHTVKPDLKALGKIVQKETSLKKEENIREKKEKNMPMTHDSKEIKPEQIIPLDEDDFDDF